MFLTRIYAIFLFLFFLIFELPGQNVIVQGSLKVENLSESNTSDKVVIRLSDGTFAVRDLSSINNSCDLSVGDEFQGGIIFYLDGSRCHGLIADLEDLADNVWSGTDIEVNSIADWINGGEANTDRIIEAHSAEQDAFAAQACAESNRQNYSDWYLPSLKELTIMYVNLKQSNLGGFADEFYWSSKSTDRKKAEALDFTDGEIKSEDKNKDVYKIRAIRSF